MSNTAQQTSINFLRQRRKELTSVQLTDKKYAWWAGYLTGAVFCLTLFVVGINFYYQNKLDQVDADQTAAEGQIRQLAVVEREYLILAEKLGIIQNTLKSKTQKREAIEYFTNLFPDSAVTVRQISIQEKGILEFTIQSDSIFAFDRTLETLKSEEVRGRFASLSVSDMVRDNAGAYVVKVTVLVE